MTSMLRTIDIFCPPVVFGRHPSQRVAVTSVPSRRLMQRVPQIGRLSGEDCSLTADDAIRYARRLERSGLYLLRRRWCFGSLVGTPRAAQGARGSRCAK